VPRLYPISLFGHFGYIDASGRVVVEPTLSCAEEFRDGLGAVRLQKWGYVDTSGAFAIAPRFDEADGFSRGFAVAGVGGKKGVVDRRGAWIIEPAWERVSADGELWRVEREGKTGWLSAAGTVLVPPRWKDVSGATYSAIVVKDDAGPGVLDPSTGEVLRLRVDETRWPGLDTIPARIGDRWGWLDHHGGWVLEPSWGYVDVFLGERAVVRAGVGEFGLVDRSGRLVLPTTYASIRPCDGGWMVEDARGYWHVDEEGKPLSGPWRGSLVTGVAGVILVEGASGWGAIEPSGKVVIEPICEELADAGEGLLAIRRGGLWGYVDPQAASPLRVEPRFERMGIFHEGLASIDEGRAYIDMAGNEVWRRPPPRTPVLRTRALHQPDWKAVREALPRLALGPARVFGAREPWGGHEFSIGPALTEEQVRALEEEHGVRLPPELRSFLIEVGNGPQAEDATGGAGPGYGLYEIGAALESAPRVHEPFQPPRSRAEWDAARERDEESVPPGLVVIGTHGCAWDFGLVITGPWAGTAWSYVDPGWIPDTTAWAEVLHAHHDNHARAQEWCWEHLDELQIATFADVYMRWFEDACATD
jgi:hypothetical protein